MANCPRCGRRPAPGSANCDYCGASLKPFTLPTEPSIWGVAPRGIALLGWAQEIAGGLAAALGVLGVLLGIVSTAAVFLLGAGFLAAGVSLFYVGYSLRRGKRWSWRSDLVLMTIIALAGVLTFFLGIYPIEDWALVLLTGASVYYLLTPKVRGYFSADADERSV